MSIPIQKLLDQQKQRYAVKNFDSQKKISSDTWAAIEDSLIMTPSSYGLQAWRFYVVTSDEIKKKLTPHTWNQPQVESCSHYVVFLHKISVSEADIDDYMQLIHRVRGTPIENLAGFKKGLMKDIISGPRSKWVSEWTARQTYIALGNLMTSAAMLGVDTCPMEGLEPVEYDKVLGLEGSDFKTAMACAVGYRHPEDKHSRTAKVRYPKEKLVKYF